MNDFFIIGSCKDLLLEPSCFEVLKDYVKTGITNFDNFSALKLIKIITTMFDDLTTS